MGPSRRWFVLVAAALVGCAAATEEGTVDGGKKDAAGDLGDDTIDENGGGGDGSIFPTDETGTVDDTGTDEDTGTIEDTGTVEDTGKVVKDSGTTVKDTGTAPMDTGTPPVDTGPTCTVVESFESGSMSAWTNTGTGAAATIAATSAHDGTKGVNSSSASSFYYRTTPTIGNPGDRIFAWVRGTGGRAYLGFAASASGAKSFVIAPNTGDVRFQDNTSWGYTELTTKATSFAASHWYKAEIVFGASGSVTGNLYDSDGTTLLSTVTHPFGSVPLGGLALRVWQLDIDTITICPAP